MLRAVLLSVRCPGDHVDSAYMRVLTPLKSAPNLLKEESDTLLAKALNDIGPWLERHKDEIVRPKIDAVVNELVNSKHSLCVIGFCWGGRHALLLGNRKSIKVIVANHPSYTEYIQVFEAVTVPTLIQVGDNDQVS